MVSADVTYFYPNKWMQSSAVDKSTRGDRICVWKEIRLSQKRHKSPFFDTYLLRMSVHSCFTVYFGSNMFWLLQPSSEINSIQLHIFILFPIT